MGKERHRLIRRLGGKPLSEEGLSDTELMARRMEYYRKEERLPPEIAALREWVLVVGYGTLLSRSSVGRTVGQEVQGRPFLPVVVRGFQRLFNLRPEAYEPSFRMSRDPVEVAAANAQPSAGHLFNGLAFGVREAELPALDQRERYYQRVLVPVHTFPEERALGQAFLYSAPPASPWVPADGPSLLPRWKDILLSRGGAYEVSEDFGRMFDRTTYLADGTTLLVDRYGTELPPTGEPEG
jgi:hypothetical protein